MEACRSDSMFYGQEGKYMCGTIYQVLCFQNGFSFTAFLEAVRQLSDRHLILRCVFREGFLTDNWVLQDNFKAENLFTECLLEINNEIKEEQFFEEAYKQFKELKQKHIDISRQPPWRFFITKNLSSNQFFVVIAFHHAVSDGIGWMELIQQLSCYYQMLKDDSSCVLEEKSFLFERERVLVPKISDIYIHKMQEKVQERSTTIEHLKKIKCGMTLDKRSLYKIKYDDLSLEKIVVEEKRIFQLVDYFSIEKKISINDILVYANCLLNKEILQNQAMFDTEIFGGFRVNNRKFMEEYNKKYLGNYSFLQYVILNNTEILDKEKVFDAIKSSKDEMQYLDDLISLNNVKDVPLPLFKLIMRMMLKKKGQELCKGVTTTNMGAIDYYLTGFGEELYDAYIIPCGFSVGYPLICASSFNGRMSLLFIRYNDGEEITKKIQNKFRFILYQFEKMIQHEKEDRR